MVKSVIYVAENILKKSKKLVIDRKDNQGNYSDLEKLQLLCYRCNYLKNPKKKEREPLDKYVSECVNEKKYDNALEPTRFPTSIEKNQRDRPLFEKYVEERLEEEPEGVEKNDLTSSASQILKNSTITNERYLLPLCSSVGPLELFRKENKPFVRKKIPVS